MNYQNPVIPGFYPDPSVCRVGEDYYLVTSTFQYFPGVPVFHSRDLVHWRQIGHCLTRESQLPLDRASGYGGIYAPTIRYHDGVFYMITTNVSAGKHFYVSTSDPAGEWSEPIWIDQEGIDPSFLFDGDRVYFSWTMRGAIHQAEIDIATGRLLTEPRLIWQGSGGRHPEAPHLYKFDDTYYLMIAEGGTENGHMETLARSSSPWGPFEPCPHNPILTHRNRGTHMIQGTGHADIVQAQDGSWWAVFLAFRETGPYPRFHHLGRETFLAPVTWSDDGWFQIGHEGTVELDMEVEGLPPHLWQPEPARDDFDAPALKPYWNFLRAPNAANWSLTERPGWLRLKGSANNLDSLDAVVFVGRRQQHFDCMASALLEFDPQVDGEEAGLTVFMNEGHHYEIGVMREQGERVVFVRRRIGDLSSVVASEPIRATTVTLQIAATADVYSFSYSVGRSARAHAGDRGDALPVVGSVGRLHRRLHRSVRDRKRSAEHRARRFRLVRVSV